MAPSLADTLAAQSGRVGSSCSLSTWLRDATNADDLLDAFRDPRVSSSVLSDYIQSIGGPAISVNHMGHHRRGQCKTCQRLGLDLTRRPA